MPDTATDLPAAGSVYTFKIPRTDSYGACQIVSVDQSKREAVVAALDWIGDAPARQSELEGRGRKVQDFMYWNGQEMLRTVGLPVPADHKLVGVLPFAGPMESRSHGGWGFADDVARQLWWDSLPRELTARFKAALLNETMVTIPGLNHPRTGEPIRLKTKHAGRFDDRSMIPTDEFSLAALDALPLLHELSLSSWRDDLLPFLAASPLVGELTLSNHGRADLDLSQSSLHSLSLDVTGLRRLVLPASLDLLILRGTPAGELQVEAHGAGRFIALHLLGQVFPITGLGQARGLRIQPVTDLSLADVLSIMPGIGYLHLFGAPGTLKDAQLLTELKNLVALRMVDMFGFAAGDFPEPSDWPALTDLSLSSIPADVAGSVRRKYRQATHIRLHVSKPRKPEWLAENLDNPLRSWDGRDGIPAAVATRVRKAYVAALRTARAATDLEAAAFDAAVTEAVQRFLSVIATANAKHGFLFTLEREEVVEAVYGLGSVLSAEAREQLDDLLEEALD